MMYYTAQDADLNEAFVLDFPNIDNNNNIGRRRVQFQFPPRITSDNRKGTWREVLTRTTEAIATYYSSGPREIQLSWYYIVDGTQWTQDVIKNNIRLVRGFYSIQNRHSFALKNLIIYLYAWKIGGVQNFTTRIENVDVKYSDTIVTTTNTNAAGTYSQDKNRHNPEFGFPLRTDITIGLKLWSRKDTKPETDDGPGVQQLIDGLAPTVTPDWY